LPRGVRAKILTGSQGELTPKEVETKSSEGNNHGNYYRRGKKTNLTLLTSGIPLAKERFC